MIIIEMKDFLFLLHCPLKMDKIVNHEFRLGSLLCKSYNAGKSQIDKNMRFRRYQDRSIFIYKIIENDFQKAKTFFMVESIFLITILSFDRYWSITRLNVSISPFPTCNSAGDNQFHSPTLM